MLKFIFLFFALFSNTMCHDYKNYNMHKIIFFHSTKKFLFKI